VARVLERNTFLKNKRQTHDLAQGTDQQEKALVLAAGSLVAVMH
jgi:hypothetical protein